MNGVVKVIGGNKLEGVVTPISNKNSILAALPACILTDKTVIYHSVPKSTDVQKILEILRLLGAQVDDSNFNAIKVNCKELFAYKLDKVLGNQIRASILFAGPLLARFGRAEIPLPGGCVLGRRSISAHLDAFSKLGVSASISGGYVRFTAPKIINTEYRVWQTEASVTSTENVLMYAAGLNSKIMLIDSASEPHVCDLAQLLIDMGANISGLGSNKLFIKGGKLWGANFRPGPDFIDVAGYMAACGLTRGSIRIKGANIPDVVDGLVQWFEKFNIVIERKGNDLICKSDGRLAIKTGEAGFPLAGDGLPKFVPRPWPGFPVDALPVVAALSCKVKGRILLQNWMYETGLEFVKNLNELGANFFMSDPQRVISSGPVKFKGGVVTSPGVIQGCMALFLASLADPVETIIHGVNILRRRYPDIFKTYAGLGANIEILSD